MDILTLAMALAKKESSGSSVEISTNINDDATSNVKAASPAAVKSFVEGKRYLTEVKAADTYDTKASVNGKIDYLSTNINNQLLAKASRTEVASLIAAAIGSVSSFEYYLCGEGEYDTQTGVPTVQDPDTEHIYLVPTSGTNLNMYGYINSTFTFLGTTEMDMSGYVQESDLAEVAFSGSYEDLDDTPDIPTNTSDLTNDAGFVTAPETVIFEQELESGQSIDMGSTWIGGVDHGYIYIVEVPQEAYQTAIAETDTVYLKPGGGEATKTIAGSNVFYTVNMKPTETGAQTGYDIADNTKFCGALAFTEDPSYSTGYNVIIVSNQPVDDITWQLVKRGSYLTEHQSIASIASALNLANVAYSGNYNHLTNTPTIPAISTNITSDAGSNAKAASPKAVKTFVEGKGYLTQHQSLDNVNAKKINGYSIAVSNEAPAAGTSETQITIVVPE